MDISWDNWDTSGFRSHFHPFSSWDLTENHGFTVQYIGGFNHHRDLRHVKSGLGSLGCEEGIINYTHPLSGHHIIGNWVGFG